MKKYTKHIKRNKSKSKTRTRKYYGGAEANISAQASDPLKTKTSMFEKSKGVFDIAGEKLSTMLGKSTEYLKSKGLRLLGLKPIKEEKEVQPPAEIKELNENVSGIVTEAEKVGTNILKNVNDNLSSEEVKETISETAEKTAEISEKILENFNKNFSTPELKEETKKALENAADYSEIVVEAMDEPLNKGIDVLSEAGTKAASGIASGAVKVGTDIVAAIPGVGAIVDMGKMLNDGSAALGDVVEAGSQATSTISKIVEETSENVEKGVEELEEKKREAGQIQKRTDQSINEFENPIPQTVTTGGNKSRRKKNKLKKKSKRVRFAL